MWRPLRPQTPALAPTPAREDQLRWAPTLLGPQPLIGAPTLLGHQPYWGPNPRARGPKELGLRESLIKNKGRESLIKNNAPGGPKKHPEIKSVGRQDTCRGKKSSEKVLADTIPVGEKNPQKKCLPTRTVGPKKILKQKVGSPLDRVGQHFFSP